MTETLAEAPEETETTPDESTTEAPEVEETEGEDEENAAEEETGAEDTPELGEDEPQASQEPAGPTEEQVQKILDRIEKRGDTYTRAVLELAEEAEQPIVRCPVCIPFVPGFVFDPGVVPLSEVQEQGARLLLGQGIGPDYRQAPNSETCPTCNGWGKVKTGSRVDGKGLIVCAECAGRGFIGEAANVTPAQAAGAEEIPYALAPDPEAFTPDEDNWHTPRSHPDFGKLPQYRDPGWADELKVYRRTLGLPEVS